MSVSTNTYENSPTSKAGIIGYWIPTGLLIFELLYGALWDFNLLNNGYVYDTLLHLGYPVYLAAILGVSKILAAIAILIPGFEILKEWAYAGIAILFGGAFVSHIASGDGLGNTYSHLYSCSSAWRLGR